MAIKKTALLMDDELVDQVKELLGTTHHQRDHRRGDAGGHPGAGPGPALRAAAPPGAGAR